MKEELIDQLMTYFKENVPYFESRYSRALDIIDSRRCGTRHADYELFDDCCRAAEEYCDEHDLNFEEIDMDEVLM